MFEAIGHPVLKLRRERYAFLTLQGYNAGDARELTAHEVKQLRVLAEIENNYSIKIIGDYNVFYIALSCVENME